MKRFLFYFCLLLAIVIGASAQDMLSTPLTLEAVENGTINIINPNTLLIEHSLDGSNWEGTNSNPITIAVKAGDKVRFRGDNAAYGMLVPDEFGSREQYTRFTATNDVYVYGNVMSLIKSKGFETLTTLEAVGGDNEYDMDINLAFLFTTPADEDNWSPKPNTTIKNHPTYDIMLPAKNVTRSGYMYMFSDCRGLTRAPELPATDIGWGCYHQMFSNCINLEKAPVLPAPAVPMEAYSWMFNGCTKLNYVKCLATDISIENCTGGWLTGVAAEGTFVKAAGMNDWTVGPQGEWNEVDGIPEGWTVQDDDGGATENDSEPFTIEAVEAGTITIKNQSGLNLTYWSNRINGPQSSTAETITIDVEAGETIIFYCNNTAAGMGNFNITSSKDIYIYGNMMSLVYGEQYKGKTDLSGCEYGILSFLFCQEPEGQTLNPTIKNHPTKDILLPATTLSDGCYCFMFSGCNNLTRGPELPATVLSEDCYHRMFEYTGIVKAPVLPAAKLIGQCYGGLFDHCVNLKYVKCLATDITDTSHGEDGTTMCWLAGVAAKGTFVKASAADWSVKTLTDEALNGIPEGWRILNDGDDETEPSVEGDVTGDGVVDTKDVVEIVNYMIGKSDINRETFDVNSDGVVNSADVICIVNIILKTK